MNKKRYILLFVTIVLACLLRLYINNTTLIVDTSVKAPNGYLEIDDYVLLDYQTSEIISPIKSFKSSESYYDWNRDYNENPTYITTKGISVDSSFEDFVNAYGDYTPYYISCLRYDYDSADEKSSYMFTWMTVKEFYEKYVKTNEISLDDYDINIYFKVTTKLNNVYYTEAQQRKAYNKSLFNNFNAHEFDLGFSWQCKNNTYNDYGYSHFDYICTFRDIY